MSSDALPLLSIRGVGKTYAQPVLAEIDLQLFGGEVLALTGENGAGKSTLSKIVGGLERPGAGSLELLGRPYAPASRREAEALGVRMVMQELNLLPTLSVAENLFLHDLPRRAGWIDRRRLRAAAREAMAQVGLEAIDPDTLVGDLGIGHQQMVEIARNLIGDCSTNPRRCLPRAKWTCSSSRSSGCANAAWRSSTSPIDWRNWRGFRSASRCCAMAAWSASSRSSATTPTNW